MTTTTSHFRLPAVFLAIAAMIASVFVVSQAPAQASHVEIVVSDASGPECEEGTSDDNVLEFEVELQEPNTGFPSPNESDVSFDFVTVADGTADPGDDYVTTSGRATIPAGSTSTTVEVTVECDGVNEGGSETFSVYYDNPSGASFESGSEAKVTGTINDAAPVTGPKFRITNVDPFPVEEADGDTEVLVTFTVEFSDPSSCAPTCSVDYATVDGSATSPDDYTAESGTLTWDPVINSANAQEVEVEITNNNAAEPREGFTLELSNASGGTIAPGLGVAAADILDDDANRIKVLDELLDEGVGTYLVPFESDVALHTNLYVVWRTSQGSARDGQDYTGGQTSTLFEAGDSAANGQLPVTDDGEIESWHESFFVTILCLQMDSNATCEDGNKPATGDAGDPTLGDAFAKMEIQDNEPKISVNDASSGEGESMTFTVTLSQFRQDSQFPNGADDEISVDFETVGVSATQGDDYTGKSGTLTWTDEDREAGNRTKQVTIETQQDGDSEGNETFNLVLSNAQFAGIKQDEPDSNPGQGLITDDDAFKVDAGPAKSGESATEVTFTGSAQCPDSCTFTWDFGDGSQDQTGVTVKHRYDETGTYTATLTVESSGGSTASDTTTATITDSGKVDRDSGTDREETAVAVSSKNWTQADTVLLATGYKFPDALAAGPLAQKLDAPLLLTNPNGLPDEVKNELDRLNAEKVIILGGPQVVPQSQADELAADGYSVERIAGINRFGTSADIATRVGPTSANEVTVALGEHADPNRDEWPDALSAGSFASLSEPLPALLTHNQFVPQETLDALEDLDTERIFLLGGPVAISNAVEAKLESEGYAVQRVFGDNRYDTSVEAAEIAMLRYPAGQVHPVFATGLKFPDGLSGGALAGKVGGPVVLVPKDDLSATPSVRTFLRDEANRFDVGTVVGGTVVISDNVKDQARSDIDTT